MIVKNSIQPKILVIGDLIVDQYLWGNSERISPEAPVQVVNIKKKNAVLGGAGNVINNLKSLDADVDIISVIGNCDISKKLRILLSDINVKTDYLVEQSDRISSKKSRIISSQQQVIRFDIESSEKINENSERAIKATFTQILKYYDLVVLSDYGKGVLTNSLTRYLINTANSLNKKVLVDPKGSDYSKYKGAFLITPNKKEASEATNIKISDKITLTKAIKKLKSECDLEIPLITLSNQGIAIFDTELTIYPTIAKEVFDVTGAGDTVIASLGYALATNQEIESAVKFANLAAGIVVGKIGSATTTLDEINTYESSLNNAQSLNNIKKLNELVKLSKELKMAGKKIVFTNGCFDLIHAGHINYLEEAKEFGDVLIVGINSDESVKRLKGQSRPVNEQNDRALIIASLRVVDYVVIFKEDDPYNLIKAIEPNLLVKGGDYENKKVIGEDIVEELKIIKTTEGRSTSNTIKKIYSQKK